MKIVFSGLEGAGKSLKLAMTVRGLVERNAKWKQETGKVRPLVSNMQFSPDFERYVREDLGLEIVYWEHLDELIKMSDCDVIIDELGNYFDARMWTDLSLDVRRWLTQGSKCGIDIYGSAQDFAQVDKAFRRLVNELLEVRKLFGSRRPAPTLPPVLKVWGVCAIFRVDPRSYKEDDKKYESSGIPSFFLIRKEYCDIFYTGQKIERGRLPALRHEERLCIHHRTIGGDGSCNFCKITHI